MFVKLKNGLLFMVILLVLQELGLRLLFPIPELSNFDRSNYVAGAEKGNKYSFYRNSNWYWESGLDTAHKFVHELNQYGFRDREWSVEKDANKKRILFIGDSFLEGIMAEQSETVSEGFNQADVNEEYESMNLGIMGVGINSYLRLIADAVPIFKPDVVCLVLYSNDLSNKYLVIPKEDLIPEYYNLWVPRMIELMTQYKNKSPIPFRFDWRGKAFLPSITDKNFPWYNREHLMVKHLTTEVSNSMMEGKTNPFKLNQILRERNGLAQQASLGAFFSFLDEYSRKYQIKFVLSYIPARHQISNYYYQFDRKFCKSDCSNFMDLTTSRYNQHQEALRNYCDKYQFPYVDFTSELKEKEKEEHLYWNYDDHMKGNSYLMIGKQLYARISGEAN
ncbi:MAG: SGNH/GDSL hydrolase family protein [Flavobacteriales bacterium]|nr:SGNH/GDSL hydrolase family protein [Flavobacteriales bacterium]